MIKHGLTQEHEFDIIIQREEGHIIGWFKDRPYIAATGKTIEDLKRNLILKLLDISI